MRDKRLREAVVTWAVVLLCVVLPLYLIVSQSQKQRAQHSILLCNEMLRGDAAGAAACAKSDDPDSFAVRHRESRVLSALNDRKEELTGYAEALITAQAEMERFNAAVRFKSWHPVPDTETPRDGLPVVITGAIRPTDDGFTWAMAPNPTSVMILGPRRVSVPDAALAAATSKYCSMAITYLGVCRVIIYGEIAGASMNVDAIVPIEKIRNDEQTLKKLAQQIIFQR